MAHRHRGGSVLPRTRHGKRGSLIPDQLTERVTGIEHHRASAIDDDLPALASADRASTQPLEIHPDQHHAVRVLAREIGIHECAGNARGGFLAEARRGERRATRPANSTASSSWPSAIAIRCSLRLPPRSGTERPDSRQDLFRRALDTLPVGRDRPVRVAPSIASIRRRCSATSSRGGERCAIESAT